MAPQVLAPAAPHAPFRNLGTPMTQIRQWVPPHAARSPAWHLSPDAIQRRELRTTTCFVWSSTRGTLCHRVRLGPAGTPTTQRHQQLSGSSKADILGRLHVRRAEPLRHAAPRKAFLGPPGPRLDAGPEEGSRDPRLLGAARSGPGALRLIHLPQMVAGEDQHCGGFHFHFSWPDLVRPFARRSSTPGRLPLACKYIAEGRLHIGT
mmetsp:Transcript_11746/g.23628  ORF Transcript_11746/g.23628 Transcript_11746/m.23628 type:complete len:206 (+) Transcript_11746:93-710(+)